MDEGIVKSFSDLLQWKMSRLSTRLKRTNVRYSDGVEDEPNGIAENDALQESLHRRGATSKRVTMEDDEDDDYEEEPRVSSRRGRPSKRSPDEDIEDTESDEGKPVRKGKRRKHNRQDEIGSDDDQPTELKMDELHVAVKTESRKRKSRPINEAYEAHLNQTLSEALNEDDDNESSDGHLANGFGITRSSMEAGQIVEMYLENFMCHRKFTMKFGKHVNFISGKNGSGTSLQRVRCYPIP